jgi:hypothetical protein
VHSPPAYRLRGVLAGIFERALVAINLPSPVRVRTNWVCEFFLKFSVALSSLLARVKKLPKKPAPQRTGSEHFPSKNM